MFSVNQTSFQIFSHHLVQIGTLTSIQALVELHYEFAQALGLRVGSAHLGLDLYLRVVQPATDFLDELQVDQVVFELLLELGHEFNRFVQLLLLQLFHVLEHVGLVFVDQVGHLF